MYQIKQIYNKYADEASRVQYRNFNPVSTLNLKVENKKTTFKLILRMILSVKILSTTSKETLVTLKQKVNTTSRLTSNWLTILLLKCFLR